MNRGQSLVELAVCAPVVTLLALGAIAMVQVADAEQGLEAAAAAAVAAAARAPDATSAKAAATLRFAAIARSYRLDGAMLQLNLGSFARGGILLAGATVPVELACGGFLGLPNRVVLEATAQTRIESWRSRGPTS